MNISAHIENYNLLRHRQLVNTFFNFLYFFFTVPHNICGPVSMSAIAQPAALPARAAIHRHFDRSAEISPRQAEIVTIWTQFDHWQHRFRSFSSEKQLLEAPTKFPTCLLTMPAALFIIKVQLEFRARTGIAAFKFPERVNLPGKMTFLT